MEFNTYQLLTSETEEEDHQKQSKMIQMKLNQNQKMDKWMYEFN